MKKHFLAGLVILLPLMIALWAIFSLIGFLTEPFVDIVSKGLGYLSISSTSYPTLIQYFSQFLILILLFVLTVILGALARSFLIHSLLELSDFLLRKIPFFKTVYKTTREIIETLFVPDRKVFRHVVLVPFPHPDCYALGLISREAPASCSRGAGEDLVSVFIPTTPNPTTGFLLMLPKKDLIEVPLSPEEAFKYVLSCGVIVPNPEGAAP